MITVIFHHQSVVYVLHGQTFLNCEYFHLKISEHRDLNLSTLLSNMSLESLNIDYGRQIQLNMQECIAIGKLFISSLRNVLICGHQFKISNQKMSEAYKNALTQSRLKCGTQLLVQMNISTLSGNESLGYIVAHSNCQWEIELQTRHNNRSEKREGTKMFVEAATSNNNTKAKIVKLWWNINDA